MPTIQSALNKTILGRLGNRFPLKVITGLPQDSALKSLIQHDGGEVQVPDPADIRDSQRKKTDRFVSPLESIHKEVSAFSEKTEKERGGFPQQEH